MNRNRKGAEEHLMPRINVWGYDAWGSPDMVLGALALQPPLSIHAAVGGHSVLVQSQLDEGVGLSAERFQGCWMQLSHICTNAEPLI
jgi:hypothetical protein